MAIEHKNIADAERHPPKGASTATVGQMPVSDGAGDVTWKIPEPKGADTALQNYIVQANGVGATAWVGPYIQETFILEGSSNTSQNPSGLDTPLQVTFGALQTTTPVTLAANGDATFNQAGDFRVRVEATAGRTSGAGVAYLALRATLDGTQADNTTMYRLDDANINIPFVTVLDLKVTAGQVFKVEVMRDSLGIDNGGLIAENVTLGSWGDAPSSYIRISKFEIGGV